MSFNGLKGSLPIKHFLWKRFDFYQQEWENKHILKLSLGKLMSCLQGPIDHKTAKGHVFPLLLVVILRIQICLHYLSPQSSISHQTVLRDLLKTQFASGGFLLCLLALLYD